MDNRTTIEELPIEMLTVLSSFLDRKSVKKLAETSQGMLEIIGPRVAERHWFRASRQYLEQVYLHQDLRLPVRHIALGIDWMAARRPLTSFIRRFELRRYSGDDLRSIHLEHYATNNSDLEMLLAFAPNLKALSIGKYRCMADHLKTLLITANMPIENAAGLLKGFQRIVVRSYGTSSPLFLSALQTIIAGNKDSLVDLDVQGIRDIELVDLTSIRRLSTLRTSIGISDLSCDVPSLPFVRTLQCAICNEAPVFVTSLNTNVLILDIRMANWNFRNLGRFFPNLNFLEIISSMSHLPLPEAEKFTITSITKLRVRRRGTEACCNLVTPNLEHLEMLPLCQNLDNHVKKHCKNLKIIRGRDLLTRLDVMPIVRSMMTSHQNLELLQIKHNQYICSCDLKSFAREMLGFIQDPKFKRARAQKAEFFFEAHMKYKIDIIESIGNLTKEGITILDYGKDIRIDLIGRTRLLVKFSVSTPNPY